MIKNLIVVFVIILMMPLLYWTMLGKWNLKYEGYYIHTVIAVIIWLIINLLILIVSIKKKKN